MTGLVRTATIAEIVTIIASTIKVLTMGTEVTVSIMVKPFYRYTPCKNKTIKAYIYIF